MTKNSNQLLGTVRKEIAYKTSAKLFASARQHHLLTRICPQKKHKELKRLVHSAIQKRQQKPLPHENITICTPKSKTIRPQHQPINYLNFKMPALPAPQSVVVARQLALLWA